MLSHLQFRALTDDEQAAYLYAHGTYLAHRFICNFGVNLYHLDSFFCEAWVCQTQGEVKLLRTFTSAGQLAPYADLVQLPVI